MPLNVLRIDVVSGEPASSERSTARVVSSWPAIAALKPYR